MKRIEKILNISQSIYNNIIGNNPIDKSISPKDNIYERGFSSQNIVNNIKKMENIDTEKYYAAFSLHIRKSKRKILISNMYRVAAVVAFVVSFSLLYKYTSDYKVEIVSLNNQQKIEKIVLNKPILITSSGERLIIGDSPIKSIDKALVNVSDKSIEYLSKSIEVPQKLTYNTLIVPKCGLFTLTLSDGTKVWLNSETELKYPTVFLGDKREVFIKGEAFFEVAKDKTKPFYVNTGGAVVKVLGTGFNVKSYNKEFFEATLVHGSINVYDKDNSVILKPGCQASLSENRFNVKCVDVDLFTAWKDGYFVFKNSSLGDIFKCLSDWYDFEYVFEDADIEAMEYTSKLKRFNDLSKVIEILSKTKDFKMIKKGKTIYIRRN